MLITPIVTNIPLPTIAPAADATRAQTSPAGSFQAVFQDALQQVNDLQTQSHNSVAGFLNGNGAEVHEVALASQKAELAFEMFQQVRNKVVAAYQEVMRTQL